MTIDYTDERMMFLDVLAILEGRQAPRDSRNGHRLPYTKEDMANDVIAVFRAYIKKGSERRVPILRGADPATHRQPPDAAVHAAGVLQRAVPEPVRRPGTDVASGRADPSSLAKRNREGVD